MSPEIAASGVLLALEKAARTPNFHLLDLNDVFGANNWSAVRNLEADVYPLCEGLDDDIIGANLTSRFMASAFQIDAIVSMLSVLSQSANEIQKYFKQPQERISTKLSKGIDELPEEIATKIFQFAVWEEGCNGGKQALWLSHTSRKFRSIALMSRSLWTTLYSCDSKHQLEAFISRAGPREEFHAFAHYDTRIHSSSFGISGFTNVCQSIAPRWRTMTLTQDEKLESSDPWGNHVDGVTVLLGMLSSSFTELGLQLPMLEELDIRGYSEYLHANSEGDNFKWAPNLRTLRCSNVLLAPTASLISVSTFDFTQMISGRFRNPLSLLLRFLSGLPNLTTFNLELYGASEFNSIWALPATECPSVSSFHLKLRGLEIKGNLQPQKSDLALFMDTLHMPSLDTLTISLGFAEPGGKILGGAWSWKLGELSAILMPKHLSESSRLTSLSYVLWLDRKPLFDYEDVVPRDSRAFYVALDKILNIKKLTISSWIRVQFVKQAPNLRKPDFRERCRLRELKFIGCENMVGADLGWTVSNLVGEFDVWKYIERVTIEDCKRLAYEEVLWIIGEEKLCYLAST
ncbi:hypothetical protein SCHPADRAFT_1002682 [Schizopora paradoxa]|uniref:F-box domain-containing protein n=1 Tax=Schizopora paradoxa TaxID=27342 RepID=A0A0H2R237_9AGAM|nr:hypothetical protein SCHPADRAFT_1002682 [Schizopora paradoxa]